MMFRRAENVPGEAAADKDAAELSCLGGRAPLTLPAVGRCRAFQTPDAAQVAVDPRSAHGAWRRMRPVRIERTTCRFEA